MVLPKILFGGAFTIAASYSLGRLSLRPIRAPKVMALPLGAALLSLIVYIFLLLGIVDTIPFLILGVCALLPLLWRDRRPPVEEKHEPVDRTTAWILSVILAPYAVLYTVHALAPEMQPDAAGYHLGLVREYFRLGAFPDRIDFYGILPQGMEMLYLFAYAFGQHSAAKLVHFAFLIATAPVLVALGRRLGIPDRISWIAAALYLCAPVVGISGTCAYTDAALVTTILATIYFLIVWAQERDSRYLIPAGVLAGFCYAIKLNEIMIVGLAGLFVLFVARRSPKRAITQAAILAGASAIMILPWMIRSVALTGNPFAPLFNDWFPNPYFQVAVERDLAKFLRTYEGFTFRNAPWELAVRGDSHGILGPLFLLLPIGLLALRRRAGRWVWLAAGLLALPWFINVGTRFLMPSLPFFALALALVLPRRIAWAALVFHAVASWPAVLSHYERPGLWRLRGFPWQAALRIIPEKDYLYASLYDYKIADMVTRNTRPGSKILGLTAVCGAYLDRDIAQYWQSALALRAREELLEAYYTATYPLYDWTARWNQQRLTALRLRLAESAAYDWEIHEIEILRGEDRVPIDERWRVSVWPNLFEAVFAFDGNQASRWRSYAPARPGMYFEVEFGAPEMVSGASITTHWKIPPTEIFGKGIDGKWVKIENTVKMELRPMENLRRAAILDLKRAGFEYIVTPVEPTAEGTLGKYIFEHAQDFGIVDITGVGPIRLFKL